MTASQGLLRIHQDGHVLTFQIEGQATMQHSLPVRRLAEQALARGAMILRMDLRRCTYMDSTFLGTLLLLKRTVDQKGQGSFALASPSVSCQRLLRQMGLANYYLVLTTEEPGADGWTVLKVESDDCGTVLDNVVQAHQELANLPGAAGEPFREVMRCLAQDPKGPQAGQTPTELKPADGGV
jgi:anti-sigma B factor antagonist